MMAAFFQLEDWRLAEWRGLASVAFGLWRKQMEDRMERTWQIEKTK